jgi:hypothetical protein
MLASTEVLVSVGSLIIGYSLNIIKDWLRARQRRLRENDAREFKLKVRAQARREGFLRKTSADLEAVINQYHRGLHKPPQDGPEEYRSWTIALEGLRMKMMSLAAALGDATLKETIKQLCETSEGLESWIAGFREAPDDRTAEERREAYTLLDRQFLAANCRVMELQRDIA